MIKEKKGIRVHCIGDVLWSCDVSTEGEHAVVCGN